MRDYIHAPSVSRKARKEPVKDEDDSRLRHRYINWASNTTLEQGSDFYVANRSYNTIVRMRQDGSVVAIRRVPVGGSPLGSAKLNGIANTNRPRT